MSLAIELKVFTTTHKNALVHSCGTITILTEHCPRKDEYLVMKDGLTVYITKVIHREGMIPLIEAVKAA